MFEHLEILTYIAKKSGLFANLETSTLAISKELNIPQQTISRKLRDMEDQELIKRQATPNGLIISIDTKGREFLQQNYNSLSNIFKAKKSSITGTIETGIGEGSYYVSQKEYQKQFKEKLGFKAFPGTLNLKINKEDLAQFLADKSPIDIDEFTTKTRTFGSIKAYKVKLNNVETSIVIPERTRHAEDIIEIIAKNNLRQTLNLKDKDKVKLS